MVSYRHWLGNRAQAEIWLVVPVMGKCFRRGLALVCFGHHLTLRIILDAYVLSGETLQIQYFDLGLSSI